jgi:hypothetical protein
VSKICSLILLSLISGIGYSQNIDDSITDIRNKQVFSKWVYFKLTDTVKGEIIVNEKALVDCGVYATAALSIIKTGNDTIRVLDLCNTNNYSNGQNVKIIPQTVPPFDVMLPISGGPSVLVKKKFLSKRYKELKVIDSGYPLFNEYDKTIVKTTWGQIIAQ